jgi:glutamate-ammonia-ligase adenylyltransferase
VPIDALDRLLIERRTRLRDADPIAFEALSAGPIGPHLDRLLAASDYAWEQLCKRPALMARLLQPEPEPALESLDEAAAMAALRRYRHAESVRQIARDVAGLDAVQDTVRASAVLADRCCQLALDYAMAVLMARHGQPRSREGAPQALVVFGLGKQGGSELNFSSDIDLVFAIPKAAKPTARARSTTRASSCAWASC